MESRNQTEPEQKACPRMQTEVEKVPGKNLIRHKTIIVDIKPIAYYNAAIERSE